MLDKLEKTRELIAVLKAALPFEVALTPELIADLAQQDKPITVKPIETVSEISYLGDAVASSATSSPRTPTTSFLPL